MIFHSENKIESDFSNFSNNDKLHIDHILTSSGSQIIIILSGLITADFLTNGTCLASVPIKCNNYCRISYAL